MEESTWEAVTVISRPLFETGVRDRVGDTSGESLSPPAEEARIPLPPAAAGLHAVFCCTLSLPESSSFPCTQLGLLQKQALDHCYQHALTLVIRYSVRLYDESAPADLGAILGLGQKGSHRRYSFCTTWTCQLGNCPALERWRRVLYLVLPDAAQLYCCEGTK